MQRLVGDSGALNCPTIIRIKGPINEHDLTRALNRLTDRHESLRTTFSGAGPRLRQVVNEPQPVTLHRSEQQIPNEYALMAELAAELGTPVDYTTNALRARLWRVNDNEHVLCLTMHHLVTDAWSCGVIYREFSALLEENPHLPPVDWQYLDFSNWQHEFLHSAQADRHKEYWARKLAGLELPGVPLEPRVRSRPRRTAVVQTMITPAVTTALQQLARAERSTLFAVMLAAYYATLRRQTGQRDLAFASLFANRSQRRAAGTVGFLANMVVLRAELPADATFAELVRVSGATAREAFIHESIPYQLLPVPAATVATQRVEDVMFQMLGEPIKVSTRVAGLELEGVVPRGVARFDCELAVIPHEGGLQVSLFHAADRLDSEWAQAMVDDYAALASAAAREPGRPLSRLGRQTSRR